MIIDYEVGERIVITEKNLQIMKDGNRSIHHYPSDELLSKIEKFVGVIGEVTHRFRPGYEMTANFNGHAFHALDSWVTRDGKKEGEQ